VIHVNGNKCPKTTVAARPENIGSQQRRCRLGSTLLSAPLTGILPGLTKNGVPLSVGTKIIDVDPRGDAAMITGIGERPGQIAAGVLQAVEAWEKSEKYSLSGCLKIHH
jgi:hypothetical protein